MASYLELQSLFNDNDLTLKIQTATIIAANNLLTAGAPSANDRKFAELAFSSPGAVAKKVLMSVLATNNGATVAQIQGAADSAIQTNVDAVIPQLVNALAGA